MRVSLLVKGLSTKFQVTLYSESYVADTTSLPIQLTSLRRKTRTAFQARETTISFSWLLRFRF